MSSKTRILPHDLEVEEGLLSCVMLDNDAIQRCVDAGIEPSSFYEPKYGLIYQTAVELYMRQQPVDVSVVAAEMKAAKRIDPAWGYAMLAQVTSKVPTTAQFGYFMERVKDFATMREAIRLCRETAETAYEWRGESSNIAPWLFERASKLNALGSGGKAAHRTLVEIDAEVAADVQAAREGKPETGTLVSWGLPKLDRFLRPIRAHEYVLVCARPSRGKSSMLSAIAGANIAKGLRVVYFTLETTDRAVFQQMAAQQAMVPLDHMREWMGDHYDKFERARNAIRDSKRLLIFDGDLTLAAIQSRCRLLAKTFKPQVVLIDYLGLVQAAGKSPYERVSIVSKAMIPLRKSLGCSLLVGQQLNRASDAQEREPTMADLRDSGQLEEDAHRIVMLHWKDSRLLDQEARPYKILQPKLRDGRTTAVDGIEFHAPTTTWREI